VEVEIFIENNSMNDKMRYGKINLLLFVMVFIGLVVIFSYSVGNVAAASNGTIYVNATGGNDLYDGSTWNLAKKTIRNATASVNNYGTVHIADGNYTDYGNNAIEIDNNMNITGQSEARTIINGTGYTYIFYIYPGITVNIQNLTLTNGTAPNNNGGAGGAIANAGTLNVTGCNFTGNHAPEGGGAIVSGGILNVIGCTFTGNNAIDGGAIYNDISGTLNVNDSTFTSNNATTYYGGAIYNIGGTCTVTGGTFGSNSATSAGGAIYNDISGTLNVTGNSIFSSNNATAGGAIYNTGGTLNVTGNSIFSSNNATVGGAIFNGNTGTLNVTGSTFTGNTAEEAGAIFNGGGISLIPVTISGSTFNDNTASSNGGAIYNTGGNCTVTGGTFNSNTATIGGAICNAGTAYVHFNRIIGNTAPSGGSAIYNGGTLDASLNWWGDNTGPAGKISGFTVNKWLILTVTANPITIPNGGYSIITADLTHDNTKALQTGGYVPDGIPVTFSTTPYGTINSPVSTSNGHALATLNSGTVSGPATVSATIDSQTLQTLVTIDTIPPTAKASLNSGLYNTNKIVTLSMSESGTIYYTLNGITPTTTYTGPITITKTTILKYLAVDLAGNKSPIYTNTYTIDKIPPKVIKTTPINKRTNVSRISTIVLKFSENIKASTYFNKITIKNSAGKILKLTKTIKGTTLSIKTTKRSANTWYIVTIPRAAIKDNAGNNLVANYTFKFKTGK